MLDWFFGKPDKRQSFTTTTKEREWLSAVGRDPDGKFDKSIDSRCRNCNRTLVWGSGSYDFDPLYNESYDNPDSNCYLVCKNCQGEAARRKKRADKN